MEVSVRKMGWKLGVLLSFVLMVAVNALANILPLNGVNTGAVSAKYDNLFTPAAYTFAIWGAIYLALAVYVFFQLWPASGGDSARQRLLSKVAGWFVASCVFNMGWIFAWHYDQIPVTAALTALMLISLGRINLLLRKGGGTVREALALRLPFGLYFGWVTVATVANITVLLVSMQWDGMGITPELWTVAVLLVGLVIAGVTMFSLRSLAYGAAVIWAYVGILTRQLSPEGLNGQYQPIVITTCIALGALVCVWLFTAFRGKPRKRAS